MTTTFPTSAPSATNGLPIFAVGTVVRVQHNTNLFKIHSHAAWSDDDRQTPTSWHLTSAKNLGSSKSSGTTRNAGRNRRNHHQSPSTDES